MATLNIADCLGETLTHYKNNWLPHIIASVLVAFIGNIFFGLLAGPMIVGYMRMLETEDRGGTPRVSEIFSGFDNFAPALIVAVLGGVMVFIGLLFCIVPGLLLASLVPLALYLVAQGESDGISALKSAWNTLKPNLLPALLCFVLLAVLGGLGSVVFGFGVIFTLPIFYIGLYKMARQMSA
jgi:uncharacterized membrane protein